MSGRFPDAVFVVRGLLPDHTAGRPRHAAGLPPVQGLEHSQRIGRLRVLL